MPDSESTTFRKVISDRSFFVWPLIPATLAVVVGTLLLLTIILCTGGIVSLLVDAPATQGLQPLVSRLNAGIVGIPLARIVDAIPLLHRTVPALSVLFGLICVAVLLRTALLDFAHRSIRKQVGSAVVRLREHIHRHALRCNPGDLTGVQRLLSTRLFGPTADRLHSNATQWGYERLTSAADVPALVILMILLDWRVGAECIVPIIVCWFISRVERSRLATNTNLLSEQVERSLQKLTEDLNRARMVSGYGMEEPENQQFSESLRQYQDRSDYLERQKTRGRWVVVAIQLTGIAMPGFIIARHIVSGNSLDLPVGIMLGLTVGFISYGLESIQKIPAAAGVASVAAEEIQQYLLRVPSVSQLVGARFLEPMSRLLQFDQVRVETETHPELLSGLDLRIEAGQKVALISLNPIETEALVSLVPRFLDPIAGQVLIDGQDIRRATLESLRAEVLMVSGEDPVFNSSIIDNITAGRADISRQDVMEACKAVHAESFIRRLPRGYETIVGDQATRLEPGQIFRLSLARAVVRKPAILVIREPDVSLDAQTKTILDDTYQRISAGRTLLFLPTRLSTVKRCDRIVMLHGGRVVADGPHDELVRTSEPYRHWEYIRFNVFR
ncbi:MAG: ABC transporter ATP-binding protein [Planctomycetaceae bacterium]|nr:ABC transporter ATP-binding protein [Planctomycetaceae bacterium]